MESRRGYYFSWDICQTNFLYWPFDTALYAYDEKGEMVELKDWEGPYLTFPQAKSAATTRQRGYLSSVRIGLQSLKRAKKPQPLNLYKIED